jgi:hypothetical protein
VLRIRVLLAVAAAAMIIPMSALAADWTFTGYIGPGYNNGRPCPFYASQAACSGWAYWNYINCIQYTGGKTLCGFENNNHIRGRWSEDNSYIIVSPSDFGLGGYIIAHQTWWSGGIAYVHDHAY